MKKLLFTATALIISLALSQNISAQGRIIKAGADYVTRDFKPIPQFSVISLSGNTDVEYRQSSDGTTNISIYGPENVIDYLELSVSDGTLYIGLSRNVGIRGDYNTKVIISSPSLNGAWIFGSGSIEMKGALATNRMEMHISGSGSIYCDRLQSEEVRLGLEGSGDIDISNMDCTSVLAVLHGSGDISVEGKAKYASYLVGGSGDISARNLIADNVFAHVNGTGDIACYAAQSIIGYVMGTGKIVFAGEPVHTNISGTGSKEFIRQR